MKGENSVSIFEKIASLHVVVVGDVMLDNYWWGEVERISPEAPVPVVALQKRESRLGGAANVALNCLALGARVTLATVVGNDEEGHALTRLCAEAGIDTQLVLQSQARPTTTKTRVISRQQQMLRLDAEDASPLDTADEHPFIDAVLRMLQREKPQALIFEDYDKGVLKPNIIRRITEHCQEIGIITAVDPKLRNFLEYRDVTIFKPNLKELREGLHLHTDLGSLDELRTAHSKLHEVLRHRITLLTLSERGIYVQDSGAGAEAEIPSHVRNIADVSGAGDTVIATATLVYAATGDALKAAALANLAGGLVCEEVGVVPINRERLMEEAGA